MLAKSLANVLQKFKTFFLSEHTSIDERPPFDFGPFCLSLELVLLLLRLESLNSDEVLAGSRFYPESNGRFF